jgi:hypothetical protein
MHHAAEPKKGERIIIKSELINVGTEENGRWAKDAARSCYVRRKSEIKA